MLRKQLLTCFFAVTLFVSNSLHSQNVYELRQLSETDWNTMTTEERLSALNVANNHAANQTFLGSFNHASDLYSGWGYDYYEMNDRYENYAFRGFENYADTNDRRNKWYYNQFGDKLTKMRNNATIWHETHKDDGTFEVQRTNNYINKVTQVDGVWVARESTTDWAVSIVGADALRAKFTPLTLSYPNLTGVKGDFQSANYEASFVTAMLAGQGAHRYTGRQPPSTSSSLMMRGGQLRRKFGALTLGATYVNMFAIQASRDNGANLKGTVSDHSPTPLRYLIRIVDDSPHDGDGPVIHDVKIKVNGKYRPDILPQIILDDIEREQTTAVYSRAQLGYTEFNAKTFGEAVKYSRLNVIDRIPKYLDYLYLNDNIRGWNSDDVNKNFDIEKAREYYTLLDMSNLPYQVNGTEYAVFMFDISTVTEKVRSVTADVTVSNDYRIQSSSMFEILSEGRQDAGGDAYQNYYNATYWATKAQADGNIKDGSNLRTVNIDFGYEVANVIYGVDAHFNYLGFKFDGEFVYNTHHYMFSDGYAGAGIPVLGASDITRRKGNRYSHTDNAYYLVLQKDWKKIGFVGEYFKMGKFYRPDMNYFNPNTYAGGNSNTRNNTLKMSMIEDNDDDDQYPDAMSFNQAMGNIFLTLEDADGVFPGNDLDKDGVPDTDKNYNGLPDYNEPFLMIDSDPDNYVFGNDHNNNSIPDFRENDLKYDTPYDMDRKGYHLYFRYTPLDNLNMVLGSMQQRGIGLDTRTDNNYMKMIFNYNIGTVGKIYSEYRYERVQDNVPDRYIIASDIPKVFLYGAHGANARYNNDLYYDEIEYRNSKVNKLFVEYLLRAIPSVTMQSNIRFERNFRLEGTLYDNTYQPEDVINTLALSNKIIYTKQWGRFSMSPGFKIRLYKKGYRESLNPRQHYMTRIPIMLLKYRISSKTTMTLGFQGFDGFEYAFKDIVQSQNNFKQKNILFQIENLSTYFGYQMWGGVGFTIEQFNFDEYYRSFENYKTSSMFVRIWMGL